MSELIILTPLGAKTQSRFKVVADTLGIMEIEAGDYHIMWDSTREEEVKQARKTFDEFKKLGWVAFSVTAKGDKDEIIRDFDPEAEKIIMAPKTAGG
jgi:hypothetical protein